MAVNIELKRSAVPGKVPSTGSLNLGEIAINTYDGKAYFKKDSGTESIIELASTSGSVATASFATSASYALTASYSNTSTSSSYAISASYAFNATSASYAATASSADDFLVRGTLTAQTIVAQTITSSTEFITGSTKFGTQLTDTHQFTGSVSITGSLAINGVDYTSTSASFDTRITNNSASIAALSASFNGFSGSFNTGSFTGSFNGQFTGSFSGSLANLQGAATYIPFFSSSQVLANSSMYQIGSASIAINETNITTANPEALYVSQTNPTSINVISGKGNLNNYLQLNIFNTNQGFSASSDIVATANNGDEFSNYIDMGINSENYAQNFIGAANDAYLYSTGNHLHIGNATPGKPLQFFVGGTDVDIYNKLQLSPDNQHLMSGSLDVSGSVKAQSFTGSLLGTASYAANANTASYALNASNAISSSYAITASYALNAGGGAGFPYSGSAVITGSFLVSQSFVDFSRASYVTGSFTGSLLGTSSYASQALSSSYALTASYMLGASTASYISSSNVYGPNGFDSIQYAVTASYALNAINTAIPGNATASFTNLSTWSFNHNLSASLVVIQTFDSFYNQIIPQNILLTDPYNAVITFPQNVSGYAIASLGGSTSANTALSASYATTASYSNTSTSSSYALTASYALNGGGTGLPNRFILSGSDFTVNEGLQATIYDLYNYGTFTLQAGTVSLPLGLIFITNDPLVTIEDQLYNSGIINNGGIIQYI